MIGNMRVAFAAVLAIFVFAIDGSGPAQAAEKDPRLPGAWTPAPKAAEKDLRPPKPEELEIRKKPPGKKPPGAVEKDPRLPGARTPTPKSVGDPVRDQTPSPVEDVTFVIPVRVNLQDIPNEFSGMRILCSMLDSNYQTIPHRSVEGFDRPFGGASLYIGDGDVRVRIHGASVDEVKIHKCGFQFRGPGGRAVRLTVGFVGAAGGLDRTRYEAANWIDGDSLTVARFEAIRKNHPGRAALDVRVVNPSILNQFIREQDWRIE